MKAEAAVRRSNGNPEVIEMLKYWLGLAEAGGLYHCAIATTNHQNKVAYDYAGAKGLETHTMRALDTVYKELDGHVQARRLGPRNFNLDASYVEWHCTGTPVNFDFLIWLVDAEMTRRRLGAPAPLRVCFTRVEELDQIGRSFFENVFQPLLPLIGAVEDPDAKGGRHKPVYVPIDICDHARAGEKVPRLQASEGARHSMGLWLHGTKPVTITLRETTSHFSHRNSNLEAWLKFAKDLESKGEDVIFVRDTAKATDPLPGYVTCPIAAWNVDIRMALYEQAKINLFVSNGPAGLGLFSDRPYLYFINGIGEDRERYAADDPEWWRRSNGVPPGGQWPWALPSQRLIWKRDHYDNLCAAWEEFS